MVIDGWSLVLSCETHGSVEHWHLSAKLHPLGRSSTTRDWQKLGELVSEVIAVSGAPRPDVHNFAPVLPIEETHPNAAHHWCWHGDGSDVDEDALVMLREVLRAFS